MKITITENQFHLLEMFAITNECEQVIEKVLQPLEKLKKCLFTSDGKYVVYEGKAYNAINGNEVPINEEWTLSDILHTGADVLSMGLDFVIPGSGAVVDVLNALSYIIEAQFKSAAEKDSLYLMAAITFAFVVLPGPLQAIATPLKRAVKTGAGFASKAVVKGLKIIGGILDTLLLKLPSKINAALKSPLAKNILGKYAGKISGFFKSFSERIKSILGKLTGKTGKEGVEKAEKFVKSNQFGMPPGLGADVDPNSRLVRGYFIENAMKLLSPKIKGLPKTFNPSNLKILKKSNVGGREVIEVTMENGQNLVWWKSTGSNVATTGKKSGEWFATPGFGPDPAKPFFVKSSDTVALFKGGNKYLTDMSQFLEKNGAEGLGKKATGKIVGKVGGNSVDNAIKLLPVNAGPVSKELLPAIVSKSSSLTKLPDVALGSNGGMVISKLGLIPNKSYSFGKKTFKIKDNVGEYIDFVDVVDGGKEVVKKMKTWDFLKTFILKPSAKLNTVAVPLITKVTVRLFNNGTLNTGELEKMKTVDARQTQKDLTQLSALVAEYEGDSGKYTVNNNAKIVQQSLMNLGYPLPKFKDDGKFGPETLGALKKFQQDNGLTSSVGKLDRLTSKKLAELLKSKNIVGSEELQSSLNSM
jgi:hypothetical protein